MQNKKGQISSINEIVVILIFVAIGLFIVLFSLDFFIDTGQFDDSFSNAEDILADNGSSQTLEQTPTSLVATRHNDSWLSFDGVNDKIDIDNRTCDGELNNVSISAWINVRNWTSTTRYIGRLCGENNARTPALGMNTTGNLNFRIRNSTGTTREVLVPSIQELNTWYHVVGVYNSTDIIIYLDAVLQDTNAQVGNVLNDSTRTGVIGNSADSSNTFYDGFLDEIRVYNRSLSSEEITEIFDSGRIANASLPSNELALWYSFDEGSEAIVHDKSGQDNNGE